MTWEIKMIRHDMTYALRQEVLWPKKTIEDVIVEGDESAVHFGVFHHGESIGVVSLFTCGQSMQLRKLAVIQKFQGVGVGTALIQNCISYARKNSASTIWCDARSSAIGFYRKLGFTIDEHEFTKSGENYKKAFINFLPVSTS